MKKLRAFSAFIAAILMSLGTTSAAITITTLPATDITDTTATLNISLDDVTASNWHYLIFYFRTEPGPQPDSGFTELVYGNVYGFGDGWYNLQPAGENLYLPELSVEVDSLIPGTTYYFTAWNYGFSELVWTSGGDQSFVAGAVPEPGAIALCLGGVALLFVGWQRRKKA